MFDDIINRTELIEKVKLLINKKRELGKDLAEKERDYRMKLTKTMATMNIEGWEFECGTMKKVAFTTLYNLARGVQGVADARALRDGAQCSYDVNQEAIFMAKKHLTIIEADINATRNNRG